MKTASYLFLSSFMLLFSYLVFRVAVRRDYERVGLGLVVIGMVITLWSMVSPGLQKVLGQHTGSLYRSGFYLYSRNPQVVAYGFVVIGFALLWPSIYGVGWILIYGAIAHMMVRTEEEHLGRIFGSESGIIVRKFQDIFHVLGDKEKRCRMASSSTLSAISMGRSSPFPRASRIAPPGGQARHPYWGWPWHSGIQITNRKVKIWALPRS